MFQGFYSSETPPGRRHEPTLEPTTPRDPNQPSKTQSLFKNGDISKIARINAWLAVP